MKNSRLKFVLLTLATIVFVLILLIIFFVGGSKRAKEKSIKVGFIMSGASTEEGWNGLHYEGIKAACDDLDIELIVKEHVKEYIGIVYFLTALVLISLRLKIKRLHKKLRD